MDYKPKSDERIFAESVLGGSAMVFAAVCVITLFFYAAIAAGWMLSHVARALGF